MTTRDEEDIVRLEETLRANRWDAATSQVWADALSQAGDPRGEFVALEHAIRGSASPDAMLDLEEQQKQVWLAHRDMLLGRAGGFPFRERYEGRQMCRLYFKDWALSGRGDLLECANRFVKRFTDALGPVRITSYVGHSPEDMVFGQAAEANSQVEHELVALLAPAQLYRVPNSVRVYVDRSDEDVSLSDPNAFDELVSSLSPISIKWEFHFTHPDSDVLLPHQDPDLYRPKQNFFSRLQIDRHDNAWTGIWLNVGLPFEELTDPFLVRYREAMEETLAMKLTERWFVVDGAFGK